MGKICNCVVRYIDITLSSLPICVISCLHVHVGWYAVVLLRVSLQHGMFRFKVMGHNFSSMSSILTRMTDANLFQGRSSEVPSVKLDLRCPL